MVPAAMSYSVWLKPPQPVHAVVLRLIDLHAAQLGTPAFTPHVTLLGGIACDTEATALRLCEQLAKQLKPLARPTCRTARVEGGNSHYQRVYLRQHDDEALTAWHEAARAVFHTPAALGTAFMPHLSIVYGDLSAEETQHRVQAVEAALMDVDTTFSPGTLALWSTPAGKTETWAELAVINV